MFKRYLVEVYFVDDLIYRQSFNRLNNAIKVCSGFDHEVCIEITNLITEKTYSNSEVSLMIEDFYDEIIEE